MARPGGIRMVVSGGSVGISITTPDCSGFSQDKWVKGLENWIGFIKQDQSKSYWNRRLCDHETLLKQTEELTQLVETSNYKKILSKCEQLLRLHRHESLKPIDQKILWPLGQQALGMLQKEVPLQPIVAGERTKPEVTFDESEFSKGCSIL